MFKKLNEAFDKKFRTMLHQNDSDTTMVEEMSPEDKRDSGLIYSILAKRGRRANAKLSPEEKEVMAKYHLSDREPGASGVVKDPSNPMSPLRGRLEIPRTGDPTLINYADMARKAVERNDASYSQGNTLGSTRGAKHVKAGDDWGWSRNRLDLEREKRNSEMSEPVDKMKSALQSRKYHTKGLVNTEDAYQRAIDQATKSRDFNRNYHSSRLDDANKTIDGLLRKDESLGSDVDKYQKWIDYDMKRYGRISDITNKAVAKAGLKIVKDDHGDYEVIA